ncbi:MAG TPA: hypothetical protein VGH90_07685 [Chthoniobacteraceae bacterium]|jgi:hypothetical protein
MQTYESSVRSRYWRETSRDFFGAYPIAVPALIFLFAMCGIIVCNTLWATIVIAVLAMHFAKPFLRNIAPKRHSPFSQAFSATAGAPASADSPEIARLIAALERLEQRVIQLEAAVTTKEFDWERRLSQVPPSSSKDPAGTPS